MTLVLHTARRLEGSLNIPGDKSLSHRALILGALADGVTEIHGLSTGEDVQSTARCLEGLGVNIHRKDDRVLVHGIGERGFCKPQTLLDCGNSGTTMRTLLGALSGSARTEMTMTLTGDESLRSRPMERVLDPLSIMGAEFVSEKGRAPISIKGGRHLKGIDYSVPIASGQVKTALLLAALHADGDTTLTGKLTGRDHTERLLPFFGARLDVTSERIRIAGGQRLHGTQLAIPGDTSSAAFWMAAATLVESADIEIKNVLLNPSRTGLIRVLTRMGAKITFDVKANGPEPSPEPSGSVQVRASNLSGVTVPPDEVPSLIDEIPLIAVLATQATGTTEVRGASELRVKETDRLEAIAVNLRRMGAELELFPDGFRIVGPQPLRGSAISSFGDHRIAMAFSIAALVAHGVTHLPEPEVIRISYPDFFSTLEDLCV